jgi:hypothetical protein
MDIARTQGDIIGLETALKANPALKGDAEALRETKEYKAEMKKYGTGSSLQQGLQAATAAIQGLAGGDMAKALAGASAPYLAEVIHNMTLDPTRKGGINTEANLMAHAVLGAVVAQVNGNNALAGASGAVMGEYIAQQMYPGVAREDLTEEQRQTLSALGTLAAGLAGGLAGGSTADTVAGAQAGKNAVENNLLGGGTEDGQVKAAQEHAKNVMSCNTAPGSASCQKGLAMQDALMVALPAGLGGGILAAATPEIAAILKAGLEYCTGALALCINNLGLQASEIIVPGGVGAGGAVGIGKTVAEATAAKAAANAAKNGQLSDGIRATTSIVAEYGPMNKGPLPKTIADTFRSGAYAETVTTQPTELYRVYGGSAGQLGGYWTTSKPTGPVQSIIDSALNPAWGNPATKVVKIEVPPGVTFYQGQAASQGGLVGGGSQVLFPKDVVVDPAWIRK